MSRAPATPYLSVIVPAHGGTDVLRKSLPALLASDLPREAWELIVVDDASTDDTSLVAGEYADVVVELVGNPNGPGYARNRGVEVSRGEVLVFIDADVCVHPDVLRRFATLFAAGDEPGAVFGSYDAAPPAPGAVSRFRNMLHHYVHQMSPGDAETFWAGCGAVRKSAFTEVGGFDEWHFPAPQIEDIELGRRLRRTGYRVVLDPAIQAAHLKQWSLGNMVSTDLRSRGALWMWMMLQEGSRQTPQTLNLRVREKLCVLLVGLAVLALAAAALLRSPWPLLVAAVALAAVALMNVGFYRLLLRTHGPRLALAAVPLHALYYLVAGASVPVGAAMIILFGQPAPRVTTTAHAALGLSMWPPVAKSPPGSIWNQPTTRV